MSAARELRLEHLLGRRVHDADGACLGRIEEVVALDDGEGGFVVDAYLVGRQAIAERLGGGRLASSLTRLVSGGRGYSGIRVPWDAMDLSDPERPRCTRTRAALDAGAS
jgi:hypothetical protein